MKRIFVEKKSTFREHAQTVLQDIKESLGIQTIKNVRIAQRYDIDGIDNDDFSKTLHTIFSEPQCDDVFENKWQLEKGTFVFAIEFLPGQFDQRADSAAQCVQMLTLKERPLISTAVVYAFSGDITEIELNKIKNYLINPVDSREASLDKPTSLTPQIPEPSPIQIINGFLTMSSENLENFRKNLGLAMSLADIELVQKYFNENEHRDPSLTEIKVLDTYWSDHCRHTTFLTQLENVEIEDSPLTIAFQNAWKDYKNIKTKLNRNNSPISLMDIALMAMRELRANGKIQDLEESEEINAASIIVPVTINGKEEEWLVMFKNETHNHPTEIEPFGGAATCLGGAIRDPLSGRSYVYQAMRVTGAADPRTPFSKTIPGKLPQRKITRGAAQGYSSYGNQIGLATGMVHEIYHPNYVAKRLEIGAVVAATPRKNVTREIPAVNDIIVLVGGRTGRDGIGGATGSSKEHTEKALENSAEVQKGDAPTERKLQRLFRNATIAPLIKRCNDFGAGGVSVAIGELAPSLDINLDAVPKKYNGLNGTELAISESQERMAVVLDPKDLKTFQDAAETENLESTIVAKVTDTGRLKMFWRGEAIVNLTRAFLDTNGATQKTNAIITAPNAAENPIISTPLQSDKIKSHWLNLISDLSCCGQRGLVERFDASIGANTILHPFGGKTQTTPPDAMAAKIPVLNGETDDCTIMSFGFDPSLSTWSPGHGSAFAVVESITRLVATGANPEKIRLTFQEYFEKLGNDPKRWGKPLASLLGAFIAQIELDTPSIGGKDSMSGSFKKIDVPPTLVSFAIAPGKASIVISPEFKESGNTIAFIPQKINSDFLPDWDSLKSNLKKIHQFIKEGKIISARANRIGGIALALAEMSLGNNIGINLIKEPDAAFFKPNYGGMIVEVKDESILNNLNCIILGKTNTKETISWGTENITISDIRTAWEMPLENVFPTRAGHSGTTDAPKTFSYDKHYEKKATIKVARPRVIIPVFPGTNCEYDTARAFEKAGAQAEILVLKNLSVETINDSLKTLATKINDAQILMIPGGFSAGDEPDGSGKFIATVFRNPIVRDATMNLLKNKDGLILGICNGFQALIKLGLVPFGEIRDMDSSCPTLTHNCIGRHISRYIHTRVASTNSPWLTNVNVNDIFTVPASHGEGNFTASPEMIAQLEKNGQIAFQYCNEIGAPSYDITYNPNGSYQAIEGIISPCGHVLGKMGHSERCGENVGKNISGNKVQPLFAAGVNYFL